MELDLSSSDCWNVQSAQKGTRTESNWIYHHQTVGMFIQHRREQELNGIGLDWIYHHQTVGMFSQHRREQELNGTEFTISITSSLSPSSSC